MKVANPAPKNKRLDLTGHQFGVLTAISYAGRKGNQSQWLCRCECGTERIYPIGNLRNGLSKGCMACRGERRKAQPRSLRQQHLSEYGIWRGIQERCLNPKCIAWKYYGGRGITVCNRWRKSFANFFADMGARPTSRHSIDRIDNDGNYELSNCRWATYTEQARNRGGKVALRVLRYNGESKPLIDWAAELGISHQALAQRLERMPVETALTFSKKRLPKRKNRRHSDDQRRGYTYKRDLSQEDRRERREKIAQAVARHNDFQKAAVEFGVSEATARHAFIEFGGKIVKRFELPDSPPFTNAAVLVAEGGAE